MGKRSCGALLILFLLLCMPVSAAASTEPGSRATGASLPAYEEVVERTVDSKNFSESMEDALREAEANATDKKQYKIIIPPGPNTADRVFYIPSNVWIYGRGAVINVTGRKLYMTRAGAKEPYRNIKIEGGTYRQNRENADVTHRMLLRLSHVRNLEICDAGFHVKRRNHILEIGNGVNVTIRGCTFAGNDWGGNYPSAAYVQPKEAVQIDVATEQAIPNHPPYDGRGSHNVLIQNNLFLNVARGVGSHNNGTEKQSYTDITIEGNTFRNLTAEAVFGRYWQNASICGNTIVNGRHAGIQLTQCAYCRVTVNEIRKLKPFVGLRKEKYSYFGGIIVNTGTKNCIIKNNLLSGSAADVIVRTAKIMGGSTISGNIKK